MELTPEQQAILGNFPQAEVPVESPSLIGRNAKHLANLPGNIIEGVGSGVLNLVQMGAPEEDRVKAEIPQFFDIPEATTTGEVVSDFLLGKHGLADVLGQTMLPAGAIGKLGKAAGVAEGPGLEAVKFAAGFMVPEVNRPDATGTDVAVAGALGAATGPMGFLPMKQRVLASAGVAALHGLYETERHDPMTGGIAAAADFITGLIPAARGVDVPTVRPQPEVFPAVSGEPMTVGHSPAQMLVEQARAEGRPAFVGQVAPRTTIDILPEPPVPASSTAPAMTVLPEESVGRSPMGEIFATLQKQAGDRPLFLGNVEPRAHVSAEPIVNAPKIEAPVIEPPKVEAPLALPEPKPQAPTAQRFEWTPEETKYKADLTSRYSKLNENDLRETINDLDNLIADSIHDEGSVRSYSLSREAAEQTLAARQAPTPVELPEGVAREKLPNIKRKQRVGIKATVGEPTTGTIQSFTKTQAVIALDEGGTITVPRTQLVLESVPERGQVATLQKVEQTAAELERQAGAADRRSEVAEFQTAREIRGSATPRRGSELEDTSLFRSKMWDSSSHMKQDMEAQVKQLDAWARELGADDMTDLLKKDPDAFIKLAERWRAENPPRTSGKMASTGTDVGISPQAEPIIEVGVRQAVQKIIAALQKRVNPHLDVRETMLVGADATGGAGYIEIGLNYLAKATKDWDKMSADQRSVALSQIAATLSHESGHIAVDWLRVMHPKIYKDALDSFNAIPLQVRSSMLWDYHAKLKRSVEDNLYTAGDPFSIRAAYAEKGERLTDAYVRSLGFNEFFAEMMGAHIMGVLDAKKLPKEMVPFWKTIKDFFRRILEQVLFGSHAEKNLEVSFEMNNFKSIIEETLTRFHKVEGQEYRDAAKLSAEAKYKESVKGTKKVKQGRGDNDYLYLSEEKVADDLDYSGMKFEEDPNYIPGLFRSKMASSSRLGGFATSQLYQEFGSTLAGAIIGGYATPEYTDGQVTMAQGVLLGGLLGALGPRAIRTLLMAPRSKTPTFHHLSFVESLKNVFTGNAERVGADAATGHGSSVAKFVRFLERNMNLHMPENIINAVIDAEGGAAWALHLSDDAFRKARGYKSSKAFDDATMDFLSAKMSKPDYLTYLAGLDDAGRQAGVFYVTARESIATLQKMFVQGLPEGKYKNMILESIKKGDYLTRQFKIFHDPKYKPSQTKIEAAAMWYKAYHPDASLSGARQIIENYIHQVKAEGVFYRGSVTDVGKKLDGYLFKERKELDSVFRDLLGEYVDPKEQVFGTISHLYTSAVSGKLLNTFADMSDTLGLKVVYGLDEHTRHIEALEKAISSGGSGIATLQKQLEVLQAYVPLDSSARYGKLSSKMVSRHVRDQLASFDSPWGLLDGTIMRAVSDFHNNIKIARTALNPITVVRNIMSMPVLAAIGGANPLTDIPRAFRLIQKDPKMVKEMVENGILGVDQVRGEFLRSYDAVKMLNVDSTIFGYVKKGVAKALDFYRWPDMLVRASTYLSAKAKFAKELGLPETDDAVIRAARDWTNRYTVNYTNVSPLVKTMREVPFTNLFISWTAEMIRISKNLVQDVVYSKDQGQRVRALTILAGLAGLPVALEKGAEAQLSANDQKDWERTKNLMPPYQRTKHIIPLGRESDGRFRYLDITPMIQIDSLTSFMRAAIAGDMQAMAATNPIVSWENTPAVNIVAEQITGKDLRTNRAIDKDLITRSKAALDDILPPVLPGGYEAKRITEAFTENEQGGLGITNLRTGRRTTPGEIVTNYLTGMRMATVNPNNLQQFAVSEAKRQLANEAAYLKDIVGSDYPQATKRKAMERFQKAQREILQNLTTKIATLQNQ